MARKLRHLHRITILAAAVLLVAGGRADVCARPETGIYTNVGLLGLTVTNLGYLGNGFDSPRPSGEYPIYSNVEHLFLGGLWVGAETLDGRRLVSTGAQDASTLSAGEEIREFGDYLETQEPIHNWSNRQNADNYNANAIAPQHIEMAFTDVVNLPASSHVPLGLKVWQRAFAWSSRYADDYVIIEYNIINQSSTILKDVYVGYWNDTTVGNTDHNNPYDPQAPVGWNYYDDKNGGWGPAEWVPPGYAPEGDPGIWMMWEHDDDGDEGVATSWIGTRLLGSSRAPEPADGVPPVSYNSWKFRGVPAEDDTYPNPDNPDEMRPGKYQIMANGAFTVGETQAQDYTIASDWMGLLSTGPFPVLAPNDTITVAFAIVAGPDSLSLLANSKGAQKTYDDLFKVINGPPSPVLEVAYRDNSVVFTWEPGSAVDDNGEPWVRDAAERMPEHHLSDINSEEDFQGYRVYRFRGREADLGDPYETADIIAEFDVVDGIGFDTGLPPLNADGKREFVSTNLTDGFPYLFGITSFTAPAPEFGLEELESGFGENRVVVYPGPAPAGPDNPRTVNVYPNPYRAASLFDDRTDPQTIETNRKIWFTGLPARCRIQVFNLTGEVVKTIDHDDPSSGQHDWNVLSDYDRVIASGLYIYAVEDLETGDVQRGKLVIIK